MTRSTADLMHEVFGPPIDVVTRADLLRDGVLIEASAEIARTCDIIAPVALTASVHGDTVAWSDEDSEAIGLAMDPEGRLRDVLWMASRAIHAYAQAPESSRELSQGPVRVRFHVQVITPGGRKDGDGGLIPATFPLDAVLGPDDDGRQCITIMHPHED